VSNTSNFVELFFDLFNMPEDVRKTHVLTAIANYFGVNNDDLALLVTHRSLNNFLDDVHCPLLSATLTHKHSIELSNEVFSIRKQCLIDCRYAFDV
jgi:hypothetical protein